jgi:hypothetical protein
MFQRFPMRLGRGLPAAVLAAILCAAMLQSLPAGAGELEKVGTSANLVPADAAFYSASLRLGEQIDAVCKSNAVARLKSLPYVQMGLALYDMQAADPNTVPGQIQAALDDPEVRKLLALGRDMFSDEVFVYGGAGFVDVLDLMQQVGASMNVAPTLVDLDERGPEGVEQIQARLLMATLCDHLDLLKAPDFVAGFKLKDAAAAREQIGRLEKLLQAAIDSEPDLAPLVGRVKRETVAGHEYLTLRLDGSMVPWDEVPIDELKRAEPKPGDAEKLVGHLKKMTLVVALGVRDDWLLLCVGASTDALAGLGRGPRLVDRPELKPLERFADRRLTSIAYVSEALAVRAGDNARQIDQMLAMLDQALPQAELTEDQERRIRRDAAALAEDVKRAMPKPGAMMSFSFLSGQGYEGYRYDWSEQPGLDGSKPLGILAHLGGNPILALAGRGKSSPEDYDLLVKWLGVAYGYFEEFAVPTMDADDREKFDEFKKAAAPLVRRLGTVTREMLIPSLEDGQVALVVDAKLKSGRFAESLPPTPEPMPMLEPALVLGLSDSAKFVAALGEYLSIANSLIDAVRRIEGSDVPEDFRIPEPKMTETPQGTLYTYALPREWGVDRQIAPNLGVGKSAAAFSLSHDHTKRLLEERTLAVGGVLAVERARAAAWLLDFAGLIDAAAPWADLAVQAITEQMDDTTQAAAVRQHVHAVVEVLKVLRAVTGESYFEDGAMVTHSIIEIRDLEQ